MAETSATDEFDSLAGRKRAAAKQLLMRKLLDIRGLLASRV